MKSPQQTLESSKQVTEVESIIVITGDFAATLFVPMADSCPPP